MPRRRLRFWSKLLLAAGLFLVIVALFAPMILGRVFRNHLANALRQGMGAELITKGVSYRAPFGLILYEPRIMIRGAEGRQVELFRADQIELALARLPHKNQPLLIERLSLRKPVTHLIRTRTGWLFPKKPNAREELGTASRRPSDSFRIDDLLLSNAELVCDDRAGSAPDEFTLLRQLNISVKRDPASNSGYALRMWSGDRENATTVATIDIDNRVADVAELNWDLPLGPAAEISSSVRGGRAISGSRIAGTLRLQGKGHFDAGDRPHSSFEGTVGLSDASAHIASWKLNLDAAAFQATLLVKAREAESGPPPVSIALQSLLVRSDGLALKLSSGSFLTTDDGHWKVDNLLGTLTAAGPSPPITAAADGQQNAIEKFMRSAQLHGEAEFTAMAMGPLRVPRAGRDLPDYHWQLLACPRQVSFLARKFPLPFEHIGGGSLEAKDGVVTLRNLLGFYGPDQYLLDGARVVLYDPVRKITLADLKKQVRFQEIAGTIIFHQPGPVYPGGFGKFVAQAHPAGAFVIGGGSWYAFRRQLPDEAVKPKPDYLFHIDTDGGNFFMGDHRLPLTSIRGQATVTPSKIDLTRFGADVVGGTIVARGFVAPAQPPAYDGAVSLSDIDLAKMAAQLKLPTPQHGKLSGRGFANAHIWTAEKRSATQSDAKPLERLAADGQFEVFGGDFFSIPVLGNVVGEVRLDDALTVGEAAGVFSVANEVITLKDAAVSAPAIGLQGSGTIGFDRSLNLVAVAAPLGDWGDKLKQSHIPIVSDVAGDIVGAVQKVFNAAQRLLLYDIHITGTTQHPEVSKMPAPVITDSSALLFGKMLQQDGDKHKLLEALNGTVEAANPKSQGPKPGTEIPNLKGPNPK